MRKPKLFVDYVTSHPDAIITFSASSMVLAVHSDVLYLTGPQARSRAIGRFFMSDNAKDPRNNGAVLNIAQIMTSVASSAAEAKIGVLFVNSCQAIPAHHSQEFGSCTVPNANPN